MCTDRVSLVAIIWSCTYTHTHTHTAVYTHIGTSGESSDCRTLTLDETEPASVRETDSKDFDDPKF